MKDERVAVVAGPCLRERRRDACGACADVCPAGAIEARSDGVDVGRGCLGCGRCMAVCPTGGLWAGGFDILEPPADTTVIADCERVPSGRRAGDAQVVPCLGGLTVARLMALRAGAGDRPVVLLDRGLCADCPAGGGVVHPAAGAVAPRSGRLLGACR